jgi:hypothetical protein
MTSTEIQVLVDRANESHQAAKDYLDNLPGRSGQVCEEITKKATEK